MFRPAFALLFPVFVGLSACGDTLGEQALLGAGAGAGAAAVLDGDIVTGAAVGVAGNVAYCRKYPNRC